MMFVDASAIVAMIAREAEAEGLEARLEAAPKRLTSALAVYESTLALSRLGKLKIKDARVLVFGFLDAASVELVDIGEPEVSLALEAFDQFGKGRHPAGLNMGDCFAYACARGLGVPLLYKGDDFSRTDIETA